MKGKILLPSTHTLMAPDLTVINQELKGSTDTKEARSLLGVIRKEIVFFFKWSFINLWCGHIWNIAYSSGHGISKTIYWYLYIFILPIFQGVQSGVHGPSALTVSTQQPSEVGKVKTVSFVTQQRFEPRFPHSQSAALASRLHGLLNEPERGN